MKRITITLFVIPILFCCKSNTEKSLVGKWNCISNSNNQCYEFYENKNYAFKVNDYLTVKGNYILTPDSLILYDESNQILARYVLKIMNDQIILINFKKYNHIDEVSLLERDGKNISRKAINEEAELTTIILPNDYIGYVYICYNQKSGQEKEFGVKGNPIIRIPADGLLQTKQIENPINYVQGKFQFLNAKGSSKNKTIPFFFFTENIGQLDKILDKGFCMDSVYVCIYGYNQTQRENINALFNQKIEGNVLMCRVDTLRKMIVNPFLGTQLINEKI